MSMPDLRGQRTIRLINSGEPFNFFLEDVPIFVIQVAMNPKCPTNLEFSDMLQVAFPFDIGSDAVFQPYGRPCHKNRLILSLPFLNFCL